MSASCLRLLWVLVVRRRGSRVLNRRLQCNETQQGFRAYFARLMPPHESSRPSQKGESQGASPLTAATISLTPNMLS